MTRPDQGRQRPLAIWGAYGGMNIGDEAILVSMIGLLRRYQLDPQSLIVQSPPPPEVTDTYRRLGVEPIPFRNPIRLLGALRRTDLVCGGGQLMDDRGGIGFPVGFTSFLILLNRILGGRPILFGIGAESVGRGATKWLVRRVYSLAPMAMVRDEPSRAALVTAGYPAGRVTVGGDIALTLDHLRRDPSTSAPKRLLLIPNRDPQRVGDLAAVFDMVTMTARDAGWEVTVMAHDRRTEYDVGELDRIHTKLGDDGITYVVPTSLDDGLTQYAAADVVVSARMHPLLLSILHGVPAIAIAVVAKVKTLRDDLSLPYLQTDSSRERILEVLDDARVATLSHLDPVLSARRAAIAEQLAAAIRMWSTSGRSVAAANEAEPS